MIEFNWELRQILNGIQRGLAERQATFFLRPHTAIWGDDPENFTELADGILGQLSPDTQSQFLSVCLGSYLLDPRKAPASVSGWIQEKKPISEIIGCDVSLDELKLWRWGRAAFPVLDEHEHGKHNAIYYVLVASTKTRSLKLFPVWVSKVMNADAQEAVSIAAELAQKIHPERYFFFWPFINPKKPTHDRSLGLPTYLSFLSNAICKSIPMFIATGEIDRLGNLRPVHGVLDKCAKAFEKKYKKFIYPEDGSCIEKRRDFRAVGVAYLYEAEIQWGIRKKATVIDDKDKASLVRYVQTICSIILGSDNLPNVLISAIDTKHEELPHNITATHEYMIIVDITKVKNIDSQIGEAFCSFLGKEIIHVNTEALNWFYWGEGDQLYA